LLLLSLLLLLLLLWGEAQSRLRGHVRTQF
jgi:hypothetical protein